MDPLRDKIVIITGAVGNLGAANVITFINWPTIFLLFGFFVISAQLRLSGFYDRVAGGISARLGHPLADLRLGQLYDKDTSKTLPRDLQESISHYQKAREFGIEIKGPPSRAPQVTNTN